MKLRVAHERCDSSPALVLTLGDMSEQQRGRRAIESGPTGKTVASNLARLRKRHGLTTRQLSGLLEKNGRPIPASGITRMEKAERQITVDELAALAAALQVNPSALLLPLTDDPAASVEITGAGTVGADTAWDWADGKRPLATSDQDPSADLLRFELDARPPRRRNELQTPSRITRAAADLIAELSRDGRSGLVVNPALLEDETKRREGGGGGNG